MNIKSKVCRVVRSYIEDGHLYQDLECGTRASGRVERAGRLPTRRQCLPCSLDRHYARERDAKAQNGAELERIENELGLVR